MAKFVYFHSHMLRQWNGNAINFASDDLRLALISSAVPPVAATHDFWNDLVANEVSGSNYVAFGKALTNKTVDFGTDLFGNPCVVFDADDAVWAQHATGFQNARYSVLLKYNATTSLAPLVAYQDLIFDQENRTGNFTMPWHSTLGTLIQRLPGPASVN